MESFPTALAQSSTAIAIDDEAIEHMLLEAIPEVMIPDGLQVVPVFDRQSHRHQLLCQGWTAEEKRIFYPMIHLEIVDDKVWIQHNQSDFDLGAALASCGIPKSQIVLGLHPPSIRQLNSAYADGM